MSITYNLEYLNELASGDENFVYDMILEFINSTPESLKQMDSYIKEKKYSELYKIVHRIIPTYEYIGNEELINQLREIEKIAKYQENIENLKTIFNDINNKSHLLIDTLKNDFSEKIKNN